MPVDLASHPIELRIVLQPEHARDAARYARAASSALHLCAAVVGDLDARQLTLVDRAWRGSEPSPDAVALDRVPWWTTVTAMAPELAAARGVARRCWMSAFDSNGLPPWFIDGLAEFMARRAVAPIFEGANNPPGYAFLEQRFFAASIPRFVRIRLMSETDGTPVSAYRAQRGANADLSSRSGDGRNALAGKTVLALGTLERWLGRPVFDAIVAEFVRASRERPPRLDDLERLASDVSGQQLSWFFDQAFRTSRVFDYGVEQLTSEPETGGTFVTSVIARRYGDARFTGAAGTRTGEFDNGRGITLRVTFADGQRQTDWWDGRDERRAFRYRSPARAVSAMIDPDRVLLLDLDQTNNSRTLAPARAAAATRWAGLYLLWLEHLLLSYASLA